MEMIFENTEGSIRMDGGNGAAPFKISAAEGLGFINQSASTAEYPFRGGQKTLQRSPSARLITVSLDTAETGRRYDDMLGRIAHDCGRLYVIDGEKSVYADCYISSLSATQVYGRNYGRYVVQFTCDYPYFRDTSPTLCALFERTKLIKDRFSLPSFFSKRLAGSNIFVSGDKEVYPTVTVGSISGDEDFTLEILNETTGKELKMNLPAGEYGLIVFDLFNENISCGGEDFTKYLDDNSYMSDFYLKRGENSVKITAAGIEAGTAASVLFENEYITAREDQ